MKSTVDQPIRSRGVGEKDVLPLLNLEMLPALRQARAALNYRYMGEFKVTTAASGTFEAIYVSDDVHDQRVCLITTEIYARATNATARSAFIIRALFSREGALAQEGLTVAVYTQTVAAFQVRYVVSGNAITVEVQDDGALTVDWLALVEMREHPL